MRPPPLADYVITPHARFEMQRRGLGEKTVRAILAAPEQWLEIGPGRVILQSRVSLDAPKRTYLVRVFVDVDRHPAEVVTVYRTSKIAKYWRGEA
ncbi:MAG: DUF4258 domain-containing protein [Candidatus Methylomirabilales bacterium]